jgi:uncharacterized membrane protein HdeD (DUF308 family)
MTTIASRSAGIPFEKGSSTTWTAPLIMGLLVTVLGILALYLSAATTMISVMLFGGFAVATGIAQIVYTFVSKKWSSGFLHLFLAALYLIAGFVMITNPVASATSLTLFLAFFFLASGIARIISSLVYRSVGWGWAAFSGLVSSAVGAAILSGWPTISMFMIGCYLGVDLVFLGTNLTAIAFLMRNFKVGRAAMGGAEG